MSSRPRALIVSAWGDPSQWESVEYRINLYNIKARKPLGWRFLAEKAYGASGWAISSQSTTIALACFFRGFADVKALVFGLDSLADLQDVECAAKGVRECADEKYRGFLEGFVKDVMGKGCNLDNYDGLIEIALTPAMGSFHGYKFNGSPIHIFNKAFIKIMEELEKFNPRFVILDVSHGVNYQTIAVNYATLAAVSLVNSLNRIKGRHEILLDIVNSEPLPGRRRRFKQDKSEGNKEVKTGLNILDVSGIAEAFEFVSGLTQAIRLRVPVREFSRMLEDEKLEEIWRKLVAFVALVSSGLAGLTFPGASDEEGVPLGFDICSVQPGGATLNVEYSPSLRDREVNYEEASTNPVLLYSLRKAVAGFQEGICGEGGEIGLSDYLRSIAGLLEKAELPHISRLVSIENVKWGLTIVALKKLWGECRQDFEKAVRERGNLGLSKIIDDRDEEVEVSSSLLEALRGVGRAEKEMEDCGKFLAEFTGRLKVPEVPSDVDEEMLRNMIAHAGLSYSFISKVRLRRRGGDYNVVGLLYRRHLVEGLMKKLKNSG